MNPPARFLPLLAALPLALASCDQPEKPGSAATPPPPVRATSAPPVATEPSAFDPSPISGEDAPAETAATTPALENFKAEMTALKNFMDDQGPQQETAVAGMTMLKEIIARARAVKTEGLPDDLREAWEAMTIVMAKMEAELATLPAPPDKLDEYFANQLANDPASLAELEPKIQAFAQRMEQIGQEGRIAASNLRNVAQKYGIESIDLGE